MRILVVEDNVDVADSIVELLNIGGHDVQAVGTGADALNVAEDFHPEVAVVDLGLPDMDGCELALRLRQRAATSTCALLALTGRDRSSDAERSRDAGFAAHFVKPLDIGLLEAAIALVAPDATQKAAAPTPLSSRPLRPLPVQD